MKQSIFIVLLIIFALSGCRQPQLEIIKSQYTKNTPLMDNIAILKFIEQNISFTERTFSDMQHMVREEFVKQLTILNSNHQYFQVTNNSLKDVIKQLDNTLDAYIIIKPIGSHARGGGSPKYKYYLKVIHIQSKKTVFESYFQYKLQPSQTNISIFASEIIKLLQKYNILAIN